ncbi:MAG: PAS domain-containing sensor histidine kinase [Chitinophagaceae bacterium]|jgi:two-component system sensor histidine kinase KdpD|nr:PAS domain-containing sensor histidine kinase [Chitinophagaceae bacterium]
MLLKDIFFNKNFKQQTIISIAAILLITGVCFILRAHINQRLVAIILLFVVSIFAGIFDIIPVLIASVLSTLLLSYFFIPPLFVFDITDSDDALFLVSFFIISVMKAIFTYKIRGVERRMRDREEKERTIRFYNTLFNSLSHELKASPATILAITDTLKTGKDTLTEMQKDVLLEQICIAGNKLKRQVENMMNMSRLEAGILHTQKNWCNINDFILEQINTLEKEEYHPINFLPDYNFPLFNLDINIMAQILQNILHNAVLYTPKGSVTNILISLNDNILQMVVADNGKGISDDELSRLFEKFYRASNSVKGGIGLGLSIVKGYVEFLNGTIRAEHNYPCGLRIVINLPIEISYQKIER